uniref:NADH-cytochrome b5 reductase n=1 Tax=Corethrella appendiculata TaxID=1370023 RepID=U5ET56_9DIPT
MTEFDVIPIVVGACVVVAGAILANFYLNKNKKQKKSDKLITLQDATVKYQLPLIEKEELSHDTRRFRFGLPTSEHVLGLPIGQHVHLSATIQDELVIRAYTPVSCDEDHGFVDLVIKVYKRNVHPKFPDGGKLSQHMDSLKIGETISFRGPSGRLQYLGNGKFSIKKLRKDPAQVVTATQVGLIAGGTGITPMLQLIREILKRSDTDNTQLSLIFANQTENDILLRNELEQLAEKHSKQFKLWYTLDTPPENWKYSKGFINDTMITEHLFEPSDQTLTLMCGPPPMVNYACIPALEKLGHTSERFFAY